LTKDGDILPGTKIYTFKLPYPDKSLIENDEYYYESLDGAFSLEDILRVGKQISHMEEINMIDKLKDEAYKVRSDFQKKKAKEKLENSEHFWYKKDHTMAQLNADLNKMIKKAHLDHLIREDIDVDSIPDDSEEINPDSYMSNPSETVSVIKTDHAYIDKEIKNLTKRINLLRDMFENPPDDDPFYKDDSMLNQISRLTERLRELKDIKKYNH